MEPEIAHVVELKFFCGFTFAEIATLRGVSERTVQRHWDKARIYLRHHACAGGDSSSERASGGGSSAPTSTRLLELSGEDRQRYLAGLAGEDPELAADLELLLGEERALHDEQYLEHDAQDLLARVPPRWDRSSAPTRW